MIEELTRLLRGVAAFGKGRFHNGCILYRFGPIRFNCGIVDGLLLHADHQIDALESHWLSFAHSYGEEHQEETADHRCEREANHPCGQQEPIGG